MIPVTDGLKKIGTGLATQRQQLPRVQVVGQTGAPIGKVHVVGQTETPQQAHQRDFENEVLGRPYEHADIKEAAYSIPNLDQRRLSAEYQAQLSGGRAGPPASAAQINGAQQGQVRNQQMGLADALTAQANGLGPSLAQGQLQRATDQSLASAMALGASQRGAAQAAALRQIGNQRAQIQQQAAGDSAMLAMNEQLQARNQLGQLLAGTRGQDQSLAASQAQLQQQTNLANQQAGLQQQQLNDGREQYFQNQSYNWDMANLNAMQQGNRDKIQYDLGQRGVAVQNNGQAMQVAGAGIGALGALAGLAAFSDERLKTDVKPGTDKLADFLDKVGAHEYRYKDEKHGKGQRFSAMAQELEKSEVGKSMVRETPEGKLVDYGSGLGAMLAALGTVHHRVKALESKKGNADE